MVSILDQHEQSLGLQNIMDEREKPMFCKLKVNFTPTYQITHLTVSNQYLVLATSNGSLLRINLRKPNEPQEVELHRVSITGLFLDPTGEHLLISFPTELLYHNSKFTKPKPSNRLKGHEITAVGWYSSSSDRNESTSKPILLGTSRGAIFEMEITGDESLFISSIEVYCKQVFDIGIHTCQAITGLQYYKIPDKDEYFVIATTVNRLYQFVGKNNGPDDRPLLQALFHRYLNIPETCQVMINSWKYSCLEIYCKNLNTMPSSLGWLTETGIFYAQIDPSKENTILTQTKMFNLPPGPAPISFVITQFHILLLYTNNVTVISILNDEIVFVDPYNEMYGKLVNIRKDPEKGTIWVYAEKAVFRYSVHREERNVWQIYMDQGKYELAKQYCKDNPVNMDMVLLKQADDLFSNKEYEKSALIYAETKSSFEEIALKFLNLSQNNALKTFLKKKLLNLSCGEKAQTTMLIFWILELLLTQLALLRVQSRQNTSEYASLSAELDAFLLIPIVVESIKSNKNAIYDLMARHGDRDNLLSFAWMNNDFERLINEYIYKRDYAQALSILKGQSNQQLWYHFAPTLIQAIPKETISVIITHDIPLNPSRLLPALVAAETDQAGELIRYLEFCIHNLNCQEQAVHNFLVSLYAQHKPDRLLNYLAIQGEDGSMVNYDIGYALRVCQQHKQREACVKLSSLLGLWENAVEQGLQVSVNLAKEKAAQANDRKLWLKIAEYIVKEKKDISQALSFIQQCESIKIEDILPFFPDFVTIDFFKDAICSSLQEYNQHIQDLNEEMEDATKSAEAIRSEIQSFRTKYSIISTADTCFLCKSQLLDRPVKPFYTFPCCHNFHSACLIADLIPLLSQAETNRLNQLQNELSNHGDSLNSGAKEKIKSEIDSILASQCLLCGDRMIEMIKKPLIPDEDYERIQLEWK